jgi:ribosomal-protein-serine acetyltransferase
MSSAPEISLRPYRIDDAPALYEAAVESVAQNHPFMPWCHPGLTLEEIRLWIATQVPAFAGRTAFQFVILSADGRVLGGCGLNRLDEVNRRANLGYWVRASAVGRGVATTAVRQLVRWAFANTELIRLEVLVSTQNARSLRVAEKAGARREGVLRRRLMLHGTAHDAVIFSFVRGGDSELRTLPR